MLMFEGLVKRFIETLVRKSWFYFLVSLVDVEANYLVVKAYQYTSITSVMLLDSFTIPCVMLLSFIFLGSRYRSLTSILTRLIPVDLPQSQSLATHRCLDVSVWHRSVSSHCCPHYQRQPESPWP